MIRVLDIKRSTTPEGMIVTILTKDIMELDRVIAATLGKPLELILRPIRKRRSKDANAYMWVLADKIADAINSTKENVYRRAIKEVGVFNDVAVQRGEALGDLIATWNGNGIGWFCEVFDSGLADNKGQKMKRVRLYKGSHLYDTKEMSRLIDYIVEEARDLDIETDTPDQIARMKASWKGGE